MERTFVDDLDFREDTRTRRVWSRDGKLLGKVIGTFNDRMPQTILHWLFVPEPDVDAVPFRVATWGDVLDLLRLVAKAVDDAERMKPRSDWPGDR